MSTASGERRLRLAASRQALYSIPLNELFELPGRPHVVWLLRSYADSVNAAEAAQLARAEIPFLFKAFETGQIGPKRMAKMHGGKPRMSTIHEYLDWTVTAQAAQEDDELDFGGFRVLLLLPRYVPTWPYPDNPSTNEGKRAHPALGPPLPPLPFLQAHGRALSAATIRSGPGYLEIPFVATHEGKRGKGYCRCLLEAMEDISRALGHKKLMLCSTNDPIVKSTWHHLGFDFTTEEQMHEWDTPHSDLVYLQNTTQMHKDVPPGGQYKAVRIKHGLFQQRMYARLDQVPKRPKLHQPPPKKAPPKKALSHYTYHGISSLSLQPSGSLTMSKLALPAPSTCTSYLTANTTSGLEDGTASTPGQTGMEVDQNPGAPAKGHNLVGTYGTAMPQLQQQPQQHLQQQQQATGQNEAQSALHMPMDCLPHTMPVLALDDGPAAPQLQSTITHGPPQAHSPAQGGSPMAAGAAGTAHMGALARLRSSPLHNSPLRVVAGPSNFSMNHTAAHQHPGQVHFGVTGAEPALPGMVPNTTLTSNGSGSHAHMLQAAGLTMDAHLAAVSAAATAAGANSTAAGAAGSTVAGLHAGLALASGISAGSSPAANTADPEQAYLQHMKQLQRQQMQTLQMKAQQQQQQHPPQLSHQAIAGGSPLVPRNSLDLATGPVASSPLLHQHVHPLPVTHHHQFTVTTTSGIAGSNVPGIAGTSMPGVASASMPGVGGASMLGIRGASTPGVVTTPAGALSHAAMHGGQPAVLAGVPAVPAAGPGGLVTRLSGGQPTTSLLLGIPQTSATAGSLIPMTTTGDGLVSNAAKAANGSTFNPTSITGSSMIPTAAAGSGLIPTAATGSTSHPTTALGGSMVPIAATGAGVQQTLNQHMSPALPLGLDNQSLLGNAMPGSLDNQSLIGGAVPGVGQLSSLPVVGQMHAAQPAAQPLQQVWSQP